LDDSRRHSRDETQTIAGDEMIPAMTEKGGKKSKEDSSEKFHSPSPPKQQQRETKIVTWYTDDDPENPLNWSSGKKAFVTACLCLLTFSIYIGSAIYSPVRLLPLNSPLNERNLLGINPPFETGRSRLCTTFRRFPDCRRTRPHPLRHRIRYRPYLSFSLIRNPFYRTQQTVYDYPSHFRITSSGNGSCE